MVTNPDDSGFDMSRSLNGDFSAFYALEHGQQVRRAYLLVGDEGLAHDVVADAFVAVYRRWDSIDEPGPYLNRCVLNGCHDGRRRRSQERLLTEPQNEIESVDVVDELAELLLELDFRQRAAVVLRFYGGFTESEIADYLGCRPGTVGSLVHRALQRLRYLLTLENQQ